MKQEFHAFYHIFNSLAEERPNQFNWSIYQYGSVNNVQFNFFDRVEIQEPAANF